LKNKLTQPENILSEVQTWQVFLQYMIFTENISPYINSSVSNICFSKDLSDNVVCFICLCVSFRHIPTEKNGMVVEHFNINNQVPSHQNKCKFCVQILPKKCTYNLDCRNIKLTLAY